jgi:hypothetical protein
MNFSKHQLKLAGAFGAGDDAREFAVGLDIQGDGIRVLPTAGVIEEAEGDCCEELTNCNESSSACDAALIECGEENDALEDELEPLDQAVGQATYSYAYIYEDGTNCVGESTDLSETVSWLYGATSTTWLATSVSVSTSPICERGNVNFIFRNETSGGDQVMSAARNTRQSKSLSLNLFDVYLVIASIETLGGTVNIDLGRFTATPAGPIKFP